MNRTCSTAAAAAAIGLLVTLPGCQTPSPCRTVEQYAANNLIFNPQWTIVPGYDLARNDWPVAASFEHQREEFSYRETIVDRQGRFGANQDYSYRRFDSTRTGSTRR